MKKILLLLTLLLGTMQNSFTIEHMAGGDQPLLGHYLGNDGYNQMVLVTSFPVPQNQIAAVVPNSVNAINENAEKTFFVRVTVTTGMNTITGFINPTPLPWNVMFHPWSRVPINTSENVDMGLFYPNGVEQPVDPIPFNQLLPITVNPHHQHYSPNNARFRPANNRQFMTFSLAAQRQNRGIATYDILIHNENAKTNIQQINAVHPGFNEQSLINYLNSQQFLQFFPNQADQVAIQEAVQHLTAIFDIQPSAAAAAQPAFNQGFGQGGDQWQEMPGQWLNQPPAHPHHGHTNAGMSEEEALARALAASQQNYPANDNDDDDDDDDLAHILEESRRQREEEEQNLIATLEYAEPYQLEDLIANPQTSPAVRQAAERRLAQVQPESTPERQPTPTPEPEEEPQPAGEEKCAMCLDNIPGEGEDGARIVPFECSHAFHRGCANSWISQGDAWNSETLRWEPRSCPTCRRPRNFAVTVTTNYDQTLLTHYLERIRNSDYQRLEEIVPFYDQNHWNTLPPEMQQQLRDEISLRSYLRLIRDNDYQNLEDIVNPEHNWRTLPPEMQQQLRGAISSKNIERALNRYIEYIRSHRNISNLTDIPNYNASLLSAMQRQQLERELRQTQMNYYRNLLNPTITVYGRTENIFPLTAYASLNNLPTLSRLPIANLTAEQRQDLEEQMRMGHDTMALYYYYHDDEGGYFDRNNLFTNLSAELQEAARQRLLANQPDNLRAREGRDISTPLATLRQPAPEPQPEEEERECQICLNPLYETTDPSTGAALGQEYCVHVGEAGYTYNNYHRFHLDCLRNSLAMQRVQQNNQRTNSRTVVPLRCPGCNQDLRPTEITNIDNGILPACIRPAAPAPRPAPTPRPAPAPRPAGTPVDLNQVHQNIITAIGSMNAPHSAWNFMQWLQTTQPHNHQHFNQLDQNRRNELERLWTARQEDTHLASVDEASQSTAYDLLNGVLSGDYTHEVAAASLNDDNQYNAFISALNQHNRTNPGNRINHNLRRR